MSYTDQERSAAIQVLRSLAEDPEQAASDPELKTLIAKVNKIARRKSRRETADHKRNADRAVLENTQRCQAEPSLETKTNQLPAPSKPTKLLNNPRHCYICKKSYREVHFRYHQLCPSCADSNETRRQQSADLSGRKALVTGGRIKIGYQVSLSLLRDGAEVIVLTRFPKNAEIAYQQEPDSDQWLNQVRIVGMDLRNIPEVERFSEHLVNTEMHLDILINNAAQTIKRPLPYYRDLLAVESAPALLEASGDFSTNLLAESATIALFPEGATDHEGQQIDLRDSNSWRATLDSISTAELIEVHLVNAIAPFILTSRLKPLLQRSPHERRFVVNVSAMEGQFGRNSKTKYHPHTNMAKAGLNMLTRTSAKEFVEDQIYMNSVDTGWITQEQPYHIKEKLRADGFVAPLDIIDGAARIYAPIVDGVNLTDEPVYGAFLKDYQPYPW